ncbi:MAG: UbiA family prenyltransferase, partial [Thermoplasmata archaeon]|nr:UbiA family prenyltransferase [Thermoplasmata archaeon]
MRFADMFRHYSRVARLEYLPAEAPALFAPLLLGIMVAGELHMLRAAEGVLVFSLLFFAGFIINALTDQEVDQKCKTYVADSSRSIGKKGLAALVIFQCSLAMLITVHLALEMAVWWLVPLVGLGIFLGIGYSVPPLHFKVRGIGHAIALSLSAFFIPFFFLFFVVAGTVNPWILLLLIGVSITHYGLALTNQSGDYMEDKDTGLATPAVRWGLRPTLKIAAVLMIIGIPFTTVALAHIARGVTSLGTPIFADGFLGLLALEGWHVITALVLSSLVLGYSVSLRGINDLLGLVGDEEPSYGMMDGVKNRMNYPFWQASSVWGAVAAVGLVFALVLTSPAVIPMMDTEEGASLELTVSSTD